MGPVARRRLAVSIVEAQAGVVGIVATPNNCRQEFARNFLNLRNEHRSQLTKFKFRGGGGLYIYKIAGNPRVTIFLWYGTNEDVLPKKTYSLEEIWVPFWPDPVFPFLQNLKIANIEIQTKSAPKDDTFMK